MKSFSYLLLSVVCILALFQPAKNEPFPGESGKDTNEVQNEGDSYENKYKYGESEEHDANMNNCRYPGTCASLPSHAVCDTCRDGYVKDPGDATSCEYANSNASLLVTFDGTIRMISLDGEHIGDTIQFDEKQFFYRGTDYNFQTNTLFYFSGAKDQIFAAPITHEPRDPILLHNAPHLIYSLAVDWIYEHLYFIDTTRFRMVSFDGKRKKNFYSVGESNSIAVNPLKGWVYWTGERNNLIERAGMDGSQREVVLNITTGTGGPNGLVIDLLESRLYWTQGIAPSSIWSSDLDGLDLKLVFTANPSQGTSTYIFKIATFDKYIYLIERQRKTIYKVNKCGRDTELKTVFASNDDTDNDDIWEIKVFDATVQPKAENLCENRTEKCSYLCFLVPVNGSVSTACACPNGQALRDDQRSCREL